jgi:hypothetical protein
MLLTTETAQRIQDQLRCSDCRAKRDIISVVVKRLVEQIEEPIDDGDGKLAVLFATVEGDRLDKISCLVPVRTEDDMVIVRLELDALSPAPVGEGSVVPYSEHSVK